jgi:hypothetical protein
LRQFVGERNRPGPQALQLGQRGLGLGRKGLRRLFRWWQSVTLGRDQPAERNVMPFLSDTLARVKPSPTIAISNKARELKRRGATSSALSARRARFRHAAEHQGCRQARDRRGDTKYTAVDGTPR